MARTTVYIIINVVYKHYPSNHKIFKYLFKRTLNHIEYAVLNLLSEDFYLIFFSPGYVKTHLIFNCGMAETEEQANKVSIFVQVIKTKYVHLKYIYFMISKVLHMFYKFNNTFATNCYQNLFMIFVTTMLC